MKTFLDINQRIVYLKKFLSLNERRMDAAEKDRK